jgi:hypothetical protein
MSGGVKKWRFFTPPPLPDESIILAVLVIQVYKCFWGNKSKFVVQKKLFLMENQKMTKRNVIEIFEIPQNTKICYFGFLFFYCWILSLFGDNCFVVLWA